MPYIQRGLSGWWDEFLAYNSPKQWGKMIGDAAAEAYETLTYKEIPAPGKAGFPTPPAPGVPASALTPAVNLADLQLEASAATQKNFEVWKEATRQAIFDAEKTGSYNPDPWVTYSDIEDLAKKATTPMGLGLIAAVTVGGVVLFLWGASGRR